MVIGEVTPTGGGDGDPPLATRGARHVPRTPGVPDVPDVPDDERRGPLSSSLFPSSRVFRCLLVKPSSSLNPHPPLSFPSSAFLLVFFPSLMWRRNSAPAAS